MIPIIDRPIATNTPHSYTGPDAQLLANQALGTLIPFLTSKGNQISPLHRTALAELLLALARQAMGLTRGRLAYALPCGAGKTQSVVALVAAANRMGLPLTFAISATQVLALGRLKRDLTMAGMPASLIGMQHSKSRPELKKLALEAGETELEEVLQDTGDTDCPVMLICHARIRGSREFPAFCRYLGHKRDLLIWDESLMTTDADALSLLDADSSISRVISSLPNQSELALVLRDIDSRIGAEVARQKRGDLPTEFLLLPTIDTREACAAINAIRSGYSSFWQASVETVKRLLRLAELPISLALTGHGGTGDGIIRYKVAVDPQLDNIAVLDASHTVRLLAQEPTIRNGTTEAMRGCKRYSRVQVIEHRVPSGRHTLLGQRDKGKAIAALVADYLRSIPDDEPVLIFTHKGDEKKILQKQMRCDLEENGIDLSAETAGLKRINWLTWGNETSINSFRDCKHVILCGITRRNPLELAASVAAQRDDLCYRMKPPEAKAILVSEMGHCVLQALSRGTSRRADDQGEAFPMSLQIFGGIDGLREALSSSLPGVRWHVTEVQKEPSRTAQAASVILGHLQQIPAHIDSISVMGLKGALALPLGADAVREAIDGALLQSVLASLRGGSRWARSSNGGRTLVKVRQ